MKDWTLAGNVITAPNGWTWRTRELLQDRADRIEEKGRLPDHWRGWRVQGRFLIPAHRAYRITPESLAHFAAWTKAA